MSGRKLSHPRHHSVDTDPDGRLVAVHRHMDVRSVDLGRAPYELDELALHPGAVDAARRALHTASRILVGLSDHIEIDQVLTLDLVALDRKSTRLNSSH